MQRLATFEKLVRACGLCGDRRKTMVFDAPVRSVVRIGPIVVARALAATQPIETFLFLSQSFVLRVKSGLFPPGIPSIEVGAKTPLN